MSAVRERLKLERHNLPIYRARKRLLQKLSELRGGTAIVIGETGSGKTTQIPQVYLICPRYISIIDMLHLSLVKVH